MRRAVCIVTAVLVLLCTSRLGRSQSLEQSQRDILTTVYNALGGYDWSKATNWLSAQPVCSWYGVTCREDGAITTIELYGANLQGIVPSSICGLSSLEQLLLQGNKITGMDECTQTLHNLTKIDMYDNSIPEMPSFVCSLPKISYISFTGNRLTTLPACLGSSKETLQQLIIDFNQLTSLPEVVCELTSLQRLYVTNNLLTTLPSCLSSLTQLSYLPVQGNIMTELPPVFCAMQNLKRITAFQNRLRVLPSCLHNLTRVSGLYVSFNELIEFPTVDDTWTSLTSLFIANNNITSIPLAIQYLPNLHELNAPQNLISSMSPHVAVLTHLRSLQLAHNRLTSLPNEVSQLQAATALDLSFNQLQNTGGKLFSCIRTLNNLLSLKLAYNRISFWEGCFTNQTYTCLKSLISLDLEGNSLEIVYAGLFQHSNLVSANLRSNNISITPSTLEDCSVFVNSRLQSLDISLNRIELPIVAALQCLAYMPFIDHVDLSENLIYGTLPGNLGNNGSPLFNGLTSLNLSHNKMGGEFYLYSPVEVAFTLTSIDISYNAISRIKSNWHLLWDYDFNERFVDPRTQAICPSVYYSGYPTRLFVDAMFFDYEFCVCPQNHFWRWLDRSCVPCHRSLSCFLGVENATDNYIETGFYPAGTQSTLVDPYQTMNAFDALECHVSSFCNPNKQHQFACATGHNRDSLLCSRCLPGYYDSGGFCQECHDSFNYLIPTVDVVFVVFFVVFLYRQDWSHAPAALQISLFYYQISAALDTTSENESSSSLVSYLQSLANLGPWGLQCLNSDFGYVDQFYIIVSAPFFVLAVGSLLEYWFKRYDNASRRESSASDGLALRRTESEVPLSRVNRIVAVKFFFLNSLYLPVSRATFSIFNCVEASSINVEYLSAAPYISCKSSAYDGMYATALVTLFAYVGGLPAFFVYKVWPHRAHLNTAPIRQQLGFLWASVHRDVPFWEILVVNSRKVLLAAAVSLSPYRSIYLPLIVVLLLLLAILLQLVYRPYRRRFDNILETVLLSVALASFQATILTSVGANYYSLNSIGSLVRYTNDVIKVVVVVVLVRLYVFPRAGRMYKRLRPRTKQKLQAPLLTNGSHDPEVSDTDTSVSMQQWSPIEQTYL